MIASVRGPVRAVGPSTAVVEVGGVGIAVQCTPATLAGLRVGREATLATALVVREDSLTLYGFLTDDEREVFDILQTASGVGPRLAQAVLATLRPDEVRLAVATEDLTALTSVPGIGRKGAQRIVLELRDRLTAPSTGLVATSPAGASWQDDVSSALLGLGYSTREVEAALKEVRPAAGDSAPPDVAAMLRAALAVLRRG